MFPSIYLIFLFICLINCDKNCNGVLKDVQNNTISAEDYCRNKPCIMECCPRNRVIHITSTHNRCQDPVNLRHITNKTFDFSELSVYRNTIKQKKEKISKGFQEHFSFMFNTKMRVPDCIVGGDWTEKREVYILENGSLITERPNYYDRWGPVLTTDKFCIAYKIREREDGTVEGPYITYIKVREPNTDITKGKNLGKEMFTAVGLLISCFFMLVVCIVYSILPEIRNLAGKVLMAYLISLLTAFFMIAGEILALKNGTMSSQACKVFSVIIYFALLSSAFWMNVMSYDIWWTCRGTFYRRSINRRGETVKFLWYCLYAWGVPLGMTIIFKIIDAMDLSHIPGFVKPHFSTDFCFFMKMEKILYLNIPMLILILANWMLFVMTAYNVWRIKNDISKRDDSDCTSNEKNKIRFMLYIKLSVVMGISWLFEVVSTANPESPVWYVSDTYNMLIGVAIFIIFVFNKRTLLLLCRRFSIDSRFPDKIQSQHTTEYSESKSG